MRVWIETDLCDSLNCELSVTLRVRVWIETFSDINPPKVLIVTLRVRVWIETRLYETTITKNISHPPREGVD